MASRSKKVESEQKESTTQQASEKETENVESQIDQQALDLNVVDIKNAVAIIEAAIDRKAFSASELIPVVKTYERLKNFSDVFDKAASASEKKE